jgi:hypothetical protein
MKCSTETSAERIWSTTCVYLASDEALVRGRSQLLQSDGGGEFCQVLNLVLLLDPVVAEPESPLHLVECGT